MTSNPNCALVTGASRGIGSHIAQRLARDGFNVAIGYQNDLNAAQKIADVCKNAIPVQIDVRSSSSIDSAFTLIERKLGSVSVLVNNAGISVDGLVLGMEHKDWGEVLDLNLTGAFRVSQRALASMIRARYGRIINISSIVGPRGIAGAANYAASKAGLEGFTKALSVEVARRGVTVNCVAPGIVSTEMTQELGHMKDTTNMIPMRRTANIDEIAACVAFFSSAESSYVTGQTLTVDGGLSSMAFPIFSETSR